MEREKIIIAIDGYSACGKSTTAKIVARELGYLFIDTGAMYRAVTLYFSRNSIFDFSEGAKIEAALREIKISLRPSKEKLLSATYLNGEEVSEAIRSMEVSERVSEVSAIPQVRKSMVAQQQSIGAAGGVVMDGRDIGTVVFPDAELKIFMTASLEKRVLRRKAELDGKGIQASVEEIRENLLSRDHKDSTRKDSPLKQASDALVLDTTLLTIEEQVDFVLKAAKQRINVLQHS